MKEIIKSRNVTSGDVSNDIVLTVLNHGGGVQTGAIVEMIASGDLPRPDVALFADTGDEPIYIQDQINHDRDRLASVGVPLITVSNGSMHDDLYMGGRFVSMPLFVRTLSGKRGKKSRTNKNQMSAFDVSEYETDSPNEVSGFGVSAQIETTGKASRQCTSEYKIEPLLKEMRIMLLEMGYAKENKSGAIRVLPGVRVESWIGYSLDEAERMSAPKQKWQSFRYPLLEVSYSRSDCVRYLAARGAPPRLSSACVKCPLISDRRAIELRDNDPAGYKNRVKFDADLRDGSLKISESMRGDLYVSRSLIPLSDIELDPVGDVLPGCVGHCMT